MNSIINDPNWRRETRQILCDHETISILRRIGISQGWKCWEAGAGFGSIASWLSQAVGSTGFVWATDIKNDCLAATNKLSRGQLQTARHNLESDSFPQNTFNLIHCRFVLEHLPSRNEVMARFVRSLKPGGWLVVEDACFNGCWAQEAAFVEAMAAIKTSTQKRGTDYQWSLTMANELSSLGLIDVESSGRLRFFQGGSLEAQFWASNIIQADLSYELCKSLDACLESLSSKSKWFCGPAIILALGRLPNLHL